MKPPDRKGSYYGSFSSVSKMAPAQPPKDKKEFLIDNFPDSTKIIITSENGIIDFIDKSFDIEIYYDDFFRPYMLFNSRIYIGNGADKEKAKKIELPIKGKKTKIIITSKAVSDKFVISKIIVLQSA